MERHAQSTQSRRPNLSYSGLFATSQPHAVGRLSAPHEGQTRPQSGHHRDRTHKIAVIFYTVVTKQIEYDESIWAARDGRRQKRLEEKIRRQARQLGYQLIPMEEKPAA